MSSGGVGRWPHVPSYLGACRELNSYSPKSRKTEADPVLILQSARQILTLLVLFCPWTLSRSFRPSPCDLVVWICLAVRKERFFGLNPQQRGLGTVPARRRAERTISS